MLDGLLRDVGQHGVSSSESNQRCFAEERPLLNEYVVPPAGYSGNEERRNPQGETNDGDAKHAPVQARSLLLLRTFGRRAVVIRKGNETGDQMAAQEAQKSRRENDH